MEIGRIKISNEMTFPEFYSCLSVSKIEIESFGLNPIKFSDRSEIMHWRNAQISILRQSEFLSEEKQTEYFTNVVSKIFSKNSPDQLLFGFYKDSILIGYGGLVHINWKDRNAEISFLLSPENNQFYQEYFSRFLQLLESLFKSTELTKIYTVGYDVGEERFLPLIKNQFELEVLLQKHKMVNGKLCNVRIYSKFI